MKNKFKFYFFFYYKMEKDFNQMNSTELRNFAKNNNFRGYGKYKRRADLLNFLLNYKPPGPSLKELKTQAKDMGLKGYTGLNKAELVKFLNSKKRSSLLDEDIPKIDIPILKPEIVSVKPSKIKKKLLKSLSQLLMIGLIGYVTQEKKSKRSFHQN